jgi:hypothetical protein
MNAVSAAKIQKRSVELNREKTMELSLRRTELRRLFENGLTAVTLAIGLATISQLSAA